MSSITLKNIKKIYPITPEEIKQNKRAAKKRQETAPDEDFVPNLQITDEGVVAVQEFNLEIKDKEFVVLVGPSGCGKSTTLRMIAGLEEITEGELYIGDKLSNVIAPRDRNIAMVFQNYSLYPHMTVYENMAFGLKLRKLPKADIDKRVNEAADILGIHDYLMRKPKALSGGQRQRVAVGRAIVRKPEVFLFDEPLSNLDAKMRVQMRTEISKLHTRLETTMIYVTHDQIEAMTMGDRICVMNEGVIQQVDTPLNIYDNPVNIFVAGFIGTPPMNFFHGHIEKENNDYYFRSNTISIKLPVSWNSKAEVYHSKNVIFGIRPEEIGSDRAESNPDSQKLRARVEVTEPMGAETYLYLDSEENASIIARVDAHRHVSVGMEIDLALSLSKAHLFDPVTEQRIV